MKIPEPTSEDRQVLFIGADPADADGGDRNAHMGAAMLWQNARWTVMNPVPDRDGRWLLMAAATADVVCLLPRWRGNLAEATLAATSMRCLPVWETDAWRRVTRVGCTLRGVGS